MRIFVRSVKGTRLAGIDRKRHTALFTEKSVRRICFSAPYAPYGLIFSISRPGIRIIMRLPRLSLFMKLSINALTFLFITNTVIRSSAFRTDNYIFALPEYLTAADTLCSDIICHSDVSFPTLQRYAQP